MIKFTPYFYEFKDMLLNSSIPIEYRAIFLEDKTFATAWRKRYNYNMYEDTEYNPNTWYGWESGLSYILQNVTIRNIATIMDMDLQHPEISPADLIVALILWGRGIAIVKKVVELNDHIPEYAEFKKLIDETKRWKKVKETLPPKPIYALR